MNGVQLAIVVMICFGVGGAFWKAPAQAVGPVRAVYYRQLFVTSLLGVLLLFVPAPTNCSVQDIAIAALIALFGYLPLFFFLRAISRGVVGVISGIANAKVLVTIILSQLFLGDEIAASQWGLIFVLVSTLFGQPWEPSPVGKGGAMRLADGAADAFIACVLWGAVYFLVAFPVAKLGPYYFAFILEVGVLCAAMLHLKLARIEHKSLPRDVRLPLLICVATAVIGTVSYNLAITRAPISIVAAISFSSPVVATLVARTVFGEKLRPLQLVSMVTIVVVLSALSLGQ